MPTPQHQSLLEQLSTVQANPELWNNRAVGRLADVNSVGQVPICWAMRFALEAANADRGTERSEVQKPEVALTSMNQFQVERYVAQKYRVPRWHAILVRVANDFDIPVKIAGSPLAPYGAAAKALRSLLDEVAERSAEEWRLVREQAASEFVQAARLAEAESAAAKLAHSLHAPNLVAAAQVLARDATRAAVWEVVRGAVSQHSTDDGAEWDVAWVVSAADLARRAAVEILAEGASEKAKGTAPRLCLGLLGIQSKDRT